MLKFIFIEKTVGGQNENVKINLSTSLNNPELEPEQLFLISSGAGAGAISGWRRAPDLELQHLQNLLCSSTLILMTTFCIVAVCFVREPTVCPGQLKSHFYTNKFVTLSLIIRQISTRAKTK